MWPGRGLCDILLAKRQILHVFCLKTPCSETKNRAKRFAKSFSALANTSELHLKECFSKAFCASFPGVGKLSFAKKCLYDSKKAICRSYLNVFFEDRSF